MVLCAAYGCNVYSGQGVSLFRFPTSSRLRNLWLSKLSRGQTATQKYRPNQHSRLCARHFTNDQFVTDPLVTASVGFTPAHQRLKPEALPSIFDWGKPTADDGKTVKRGRESAEAIRKKKLKLEVGMVRY